MLAWWKSMSEKDEKDDAESGEDGAGVSCDLGFNCVVFHGLSEVGRCSSLELNPMACHGEVSLRLHNLSQPQTLQAANQDHVPRS